MLLGVREQLGDALVADGHPLRVYVPYGSHWHEYSVRRFKENPQLAQHVDADVVDRTRGGWDMSAGASRARRWSYRCRARHRPRHRAAVREPRGRGGRRGRHHRGRRGRDGRLIGRRGRRPRPSSPTSPTSGRVESRRRDRAGAPPRRHRSTTTPAACAAVASPSSTGRGMGHDLRRQRSLDVPRLPRADPSHATAAGRSSTPRRPPGWSGERRTPAYNASKGAVIQPHAAARRRLHTRGDPRQLRLPRLGADRLQRPGARET